ncbi:hypothetical protein K440DRAFT_615709 [Wilcoxina mikolae CBS 423.85]|nr:hypothetical protein K440DRAFT_615709 [Wilcoxina mikolae CBS 423.85]
MANAGFHMISCLGFVCVRSKLTTPQVYGVCAVPNNVKWRNYRTISYAKARCSEGIRGKKKETGQPPRASTTASESIIGSSHTSSSTR